MLAGDGVFVTFHRDDRSHAACFDARDGSARWECPAPRAYTAEEDREGGPALRAAPTPVTDGVALFVWFPEYGFVGYELDGTERWRLPLVRFHAPFPGASSPALARGRLVHVHDHDRESFLIAIDPEDGSVLWKTERPFATHGFSSPTILDEVIIVSGSHRVDAYDLETGRHLWMVEGMAWQARSTPVGGDGVVFVASVVNRASGFGGRILAKGWPQALGAWDADGDGRLVPTELGELDLPEQWWGYHDTDLDGAIGQTEWDRLRERMRSGSGLWALRLGTEESVGETRELWTKKRRGLMNTTPLLVGDVLVTVRDGWFATGLDAKDGSERWTASVDEMRSKVFSSPVSIGGVVLSIDENGMMVILDPSDGRVVSTHQLEEDVWATPAVSRDALYVRTHDALHAFRLGDESNDHGTQAFVGVNVLTMDDRGQLRDQTVVVTEGRVVALGPREETPLPAGTEVLARGAGLTVLPGLIDSWARVEDELELLRHLLAGVTTLRIFDGRPALLELRECIRRGDVPGPELVVGGPVLSARLSPSESAAAVDAASAAGYDFACSEIGVPPEVWLAGAERAEELGFPFAGARPRQLPLDEALATAPWTLDRVEMLLGPDGPGESLKRSGVAVTPVVYSFSMWIEAAKHRHKWIENENTVRDISPTVRLLWSPAAGPLHRGLPRRDLEHRNRSRQAQTAWIRKLDQAGVPLLAGSDAIASFVHPGQGLHRELRVFTSSGLPPDRVLQAATSTPGRVFERVLGEPRGTVTIGGAADLVVVAGDPLSNLRLLETPSGIMVAGRWYRRGVLEAALDLARETWLREKDFVNEVVALRSSDDTSLAEYLAGEERLELDLRESTVRRLAQLLRLPEFHRDRDAAVVEAFADRRWAEVAESD